VATGLEKVCFHSNIKERQSQSQRKFKLSYNCIHFHMSARLGSKSFKLSFSSMRTENFEMYKLDLENTEEPEIKFSTSVAHRKSKGIPKSIYFCFIDYTKAFDYVDHNQLENSSRDGNTRPLYLPPEKPAYRSRSNSWIRTWNNRLVPKSERSTSRLYTVTLLI